MIENLYPNFLEDPQDYRSSEEFWKRLWKDMSQTARERYEWRQPWFDPLPWDVSQGSPIFSAVSDTLKRGVRILQSPPTGKGLEFFVYTDRFGGSIFDPDSIQELVISCALSQPAADLASSIISKWVENNAITVKNKGIPLVVAAHGSNRSFPFASPYSAA